MLENARGAVLNRVILLLTTTEVQLYVRQGFFASGNDLLDMGGGPIKHIDNLKLIVLRLQRRDSTGQEAKIVRLECGETQFSTRGSGKERGRGTVWHKVGVYEVEIPEIGEGVNETDERAPGEGNAVERQ